MKIKKDILQILILLILFTGVSITQILIRHSILSIDVFLILLIVCCSIFFRGKKYDLATSNFKYHIAAIILVVLLRFLLDIFEQPTISPGPYKIFFVNGLFYSTYYLLHRDIYKLNIKTVINLFMIISVIISLINIVQLMLPSIPITVSSISLEESLKQFQNQKYNRLQTVYYHYSSLAILLSLFYITSNDVKLSDKLKYGIFISLNMITIISNGYRATLYTILAITILYITLSLNKLSNLNKALSMTLLTGMFIAIYFYTEQRNIETANVIGVDSSLFYRWVETNIGLEKLMYENKLLFGIGYLDGILNPLAPIDKETYFLHNGYVSILYNYGMVGTLVWLIFLLSILKFIAKNIRSIISHKLKLLISLYLIGQLFVNYTNGIFNRDISATFCFIFALVLLEKLCTDVLRGPNRHAYPPPS